MFGSFRALRAVVAMAALAILAACGGGGGGGGGGEGGGNNSSYAVAFLPSSLTAEWRDRAGSSALTVRATFASVPSGTVFPVVVMGATDFQTGPVSVRQIDANTFEADLMPNPSLPAGVHRGTLQLRLCKDALCASEYTVTGGNLPYEFTVSPTVAVTVKINGVLLVDGAGNPLEALEDSGLSIDIPDGATVELTSRAPVDWVTDVHEQDNTITTLSSTQTTWRGTLSGSRNTNGLSVVAIPMDPNQRTADVTFYIR